MSATRGWSSEIYKSSPTLYVNFNKKLPETTDGGGDRKLPERLEVYLGDDSFITISVLLHLIKFHCDMKKEKSTLLIIQKMYNSNETVTKYRRI